MTYPHPESQNSEPDEALHKAFKEVGRRLADLQGDRTAKYICVQLDLMRQHDLIDEDTYQRAKALIRERLKKTEPSILGTLDYAYTLLVWIVEVKKHVDYPEVNDAEVRQARLNWCEALAREFDPSTR